MTINDVISIRRGANHSIIGVYTFSREYVPFDELPQSVQQELCEQWVAPLLED